MADKKKVTLSPPPSSRRLVNNEGFILNDWLRYFNSFYLRMGGPDAPTNTELKENNVSNSNDITELKENIQTNADNITSLDKRLTVSERDITTLNNNDSSQDKSILANSKAIDESNRKIETANENIETNMNDINLLKEKKDFEIWTSLKKGDQYKQKIVYYTVAASICYSVDGTNWKKIGDNSDVV